MAVIVQLVQGLQTLAGNLTNPANLTQILSTLAIGIVVILILIQIAQRINVNKNAPPEVPYWIPYLGSAISFSLNPLKFYDDNRKKYGDVFTYTMVGRKFTVCLGIEGNNFVFNAKLADVSAEESYKPLTTPVFGKGVVYDCPNNMLMEQKRFVKWGMTNDAFRAYVSEIEEETREYFKRWNNKVGGRGDLFTAMGELIINTASRTLLGPEIRALMDESVAQLYHDLDGGFQPINMFFEWLPLPSYFRRDNAHEKMRAIFMKVIEERRANNVTNKTDMLQSLMNQTYKDGTPFTDRDACHLMIALLMAGQHTSSTTATWALLFLAENPQILKELVEEQKDVLGSLDAPLTFDHLKSMTLLDNVIRETLRLRPPIIMILRKVLRPITFPGTDYVIPKGNYIAASPIATQVDEQYYKDATKFDPHRWETIVEEETGETVDYGFGKIAGGGARNPSLPFGAGRHRCIGEAFAYVQLKAVISTFVRMYDLSLTEKGMPGSDFTKMFVQPVLPVEINYTPRK
ncbi:Lanosterol 14-alpha-demethylase [Lobosporangium transversale]|uniref:Cytochrome P450 51 n=1 Tax=Lobosporangium transversale TaxID=64571 RepID=A0A1Y2GCD8_9FUNG|nr:cytochrome P450 51 [Lobosporangium transversale]KAF9915380.1 Lanosterol 14-alpha-demethylase [Lobosporangium transversale]ORZ05127.1 cytochrome P450 51 [Lobosporangium transversale]|eukprot:XP_021876902.1 cytochrome P450 51 [Lobosporangium transversale]